MNNPVVYVLWLLATGGAILAYVTRRRKRSMVAKDQSSEKPTQA